MSASKRKGTAWESAIVDYVDAAGLFCFRRTLAGARDEGDVHVVLDGEVVVIEAKNAKATELACWLDEANVEAEHAEAVGGVVWHHRRGRSSPGAGFVTMDGAMFVRLLKRRGVQ